MKRITLILTLLLTTLLAANAQNSISSRIIGAWNADISQLMSDSEMKSPKLSLILGANHRGTTTVSGKMEQTTDDGDIKMTLKFWMPATWSLKTGNTLQVKHNTDAIKLKISQMSLNGQDMSEYLSAINETVAETTKAEMADDLEEMLLKNITFSNNNTFTATIDDQRVTFRRVVMSKK